ncbi:multiple sugar transport system permease protein [Murinocardiopsis flavida]|uniref:Multiple sugar transport system permease protein n=1 Tax=Murinocardiopsis flavida TaxID=645275 RepID=A0A2P8CPJ9_9ACTN|nr:carbohydrate ABC transporter permease [Murinocardiopsis flavida]PSK86898.1 multiple sugar transport system permease protein [Murinocardiopsis flavida]
MSTSDANPARRAARGTGTAAQRSAEHRRRRTRTLAAGVVLYIVLVAVAAVFLLPYYLIARNGLSTPAEITSPEWTLFPAALQWGNIAELFTGAGSQMATGLRNSAVVAVLQTGGQLLVCSLAGYALARIPYRHADAVFYAIVATLMIPAAVTFVPTFVMVSSLGWVSSLRGLVVPMLFSGFTAFLFRQFFLNFPRELEDAARVDGLGYWGTYWRVVVPNSLQFFAAIGLITFIGSWNAFLWPLVIAQDSQAWTVQIVLSTYLTAQTIELQELFAAAMVSVAPLVLVFLFFQRYIVQGVTETGIKG